MEPPLARKPPRQLHWVSRRLMLGALTTGFLCMLSQHFYFSSRVGQPVGDSYFEQQISRFTGNLLSILVQSLLALSMDTAYTQWLFYRLSRTRDGIPVKSVDAAYGAPVSLLYLISWDLVVHLPDLSTLALFIMLLNIPTTVTPGAQYIVSAAIPSYTMANIPQLQISTSDPDKAGAFHFSRPVDGPGSPNNGSMYFLGPRSIVSRLMTAAAAMGETLSLAAPATNASYSLNFAGPYVQCREAEDSVANIISAVIDANSVTPTNASEIYNYYYAYIPDLNSTDGWGQPSNRSVDPTKASNELWLSFKQNGTGWNASDFPRCPTTVFQRCQLFNAAYEVEVSFTEGRMTLANTTSVDPTPIPYPITDSNKDSDPQQLAYSAYMWAFTDLLSGSMGYYQQADPHDANVTLYTQIQSNIKDTALLGSADLDCYFAVDWEFANLTWRPDTGQRLEDIQFAGNQTLDNMIPQLSVNLTISLMNNDILAPLEPSQVLVVNSVNVYEYSRITLLLPYGLELIAAIAVNILGLIAFTKNPFRMDRSFIMAASATQHTQMLGQEHRHSLGSIPFPPEARRQRLRFEGSLGRGWNFVVLM
ncbi:hypothetical protein GQ53DRAFT_656704 [Thozetella sp. PMI_491]|nr:hypothetical protein GQ53DRAFT_656704 [Thozetella sp. PMI_491]